MDVFIPLCPRVQLTLLLTMLWHLQTIEKSVTSISIAWICKPQISVLHPLEGYWGSSHNTLHCHLLFHWQLHKSLPVNIRCLLPSSSSHKRSLRNIFFCFDQTMQIYIYTPSGTILISIRGIDKSFVVSLYVFIFTIWQSLFNRD